MLKSTLKLLFPFLFFVFPCFLTAESIVKEKINDTLELEIHNLKPLSPVILNFSSDVILEAGYKNGRKCSWDLTKNIPDQLQPFTPAKKSFPQTQSPDQKYTAEAPGDGFIRIYDSEGNVFQVIEIFSGKVTSLCFSINARFLFAGTSEAIISVYDVRTGALKHILNGHSGPVTAISASPSGKFLATADSKGLLRLRSTTDFSVKRTFLCSSSSFIEWNDEGTVSGSENLTVNRQEGLVQATFKNTTENIPEADNNSGFAAGVFYNQENPFDPENKYVSSRMGAGITAEYLSPWHAGAAVSLGFNCGVTNGQTVTSWNTFILQTGLFYNIPAGAVLEFQPEFNLGFNFNSTKLKSKEGESKSDFTDFFVQPGIALRCRLSAHNYLETALFYKCAVEKSQKLNALGYRTGYVFKF